jgi:hypothetical protein
LLIVLCISQQQNKPIRFSQCAAFLFFLSCTGADALSTSTYPENLLTATACSLRSLDLSEGLLPLPPPFPALKQAATALHAPSLQRANHHAPIQIRGTLHTC